jgi:Skp family chaperone for outer membrane proteins
MSTVEQDVTNLKTDMAELRAIVRELALSQQRTEIELQNFKEFVLTSQANWEQRWAKLEQERKMEQQEREKERQALLQFQQSVSEFQKSVSEFKQSVLEDSQRWEKERREMSKRWGELANKMGTLVEDIVAPNIRRVAKELFGVEEIDFSVRRVVHHPTDKSRLKDFDALLIGADAIVLNETKSTVRQSYIDDFIAFIPTVFEYLPEHTGKRVIPVFSSLYIPEQFVRYLTANKIYAMAMGDETMEILNYNDIPKP